MALAPPAPPSAVRLGCPVGSRQPPSQWRVQPFLAGSLVPGGLTADGGHRS